MDGQIDPSRIITHEVSLEDAPVIYKKFRDKEDGCVKLLLKPGLGAATNGSTRTAARETV